jgi:hypothetical protein
MLCAGYTKVWDLAPGEIVRLNGAQGTTLRVTRGTLWITQYRDIRDIVLSAGDAFTVDRGGLTVIEARDSATVCVLARHADEVRVRGRRPTLARRLHAWLHAAWTAGAASRRSVPYF